MHPLHPAFNQKESSAAIAINSEVLGQSENSYHTICIKQGTYKSLQL